jgi:hypothetical protein
MRFTIPLVQLAQSWASVYHPTQYGSLAINVRRSNLLLSSSSCYVQGLKNLALDLFLALQNLSAARYLPSSSSRGTFRGDLLRFGSLVVEDDVDVNSVIPLIERVIEHAANKDIYYIRSLLSEVSSSSITLSSYSDQDRK